MPDSIRIGCRPVKDESGDRECLALHARASQRRRWIISVAAIRKSSASAMIPQLERAGSSTAAP
jgi:hypothetical protein